VQDREDSWAEVTPKFGAEYRFTDDVFFYGTISKGFKSGGFNGTGIQPSFDPEIIWAYEVGAKTEWFDNRLRANVALFYYDYSDMQVWAFTETPGVTEIRNAAESEIKGFELELLARPVPPLTLSAGISYLDAAYEDLMYAPEWQFNATAQYVFSLSDYGFVTFSGGYSWQDDAPTDPIGDALRRIDNYGVFNALASFETADGKWRFDLYGKNLANEEYFTQLWAGATAVGILDYGQIGEPRTYGARLTFRFGAQ